uniref:monogalactosyldiacylglycerol synthase n=1 Tax=Araucaria cunninghamii TaxID=56994 RepID=A0A0D6R6J8_ARACU
MEMMHVVGERTKTVLILMSDTGGGHRASAEAIKEAFRIEFGDEYEVYVTDLFQEHTPWPFNQMPRSYNFLVRHETLWKVAFHGTIPRCVHYPQLRAASAFIASKMEKGLRKYQPDIIISVHPLMQHIPIRIIESWDFPKKILFTTVITDLNTCHPTWFHNRVARCYCPTSEVAKRAFGRGLASSQARVYGLPIRPSFSKNVRHKAELRKEMGMNEDLPAVLLMGGGEGMGPVEATAMALEETLYNNNLGKAIGQLVVICGRNEELANKLEPVDWKIPVQIRGFVSNMEEWMEACDCIITKAGPGTIAEALVRGLPIILNDFIAGQEEGNVPYVVDNGAGVFCKSPKETANIVARWFNPKCVELKKMSENSLKLAQPNAVFDIVRDLHDLIRQRDSMPKYLYSPFDF